MTYDEIKTIAVNDMYNNPGGSGTLFTDQFVGRALNNALMDYWRKFQDNEFGYFRFSEKTLSVTTATNIYALPNGNPGASDTDNVAIVTAMAQRTGSGSSAAYTPLLPFFPTDKYNQGNVFGPSYAYITNQVSSSGAPQWALEKGIRVSGYPTYYIRFKPWWGQSATVVYDGVRYPTLIDATDPDPDEIPDLPEHLHDGLVLRIYKSCLQKVHADLSEINQEIKDFDIEAFKVELASVQRMGSYRIKGAPGTPGRWV